MSLFFYRRHVSMHLTSFLEIFLVEGSKLSKYFLLKVYTCYILLPGGWVEKIMFGLCAFFCYDFWYLTMFFMAVLLLLKYLIASCRIWTSTWKLQEPVSSCENRKCLDEHFVMTFCCRSMKKEERKGISAKRWHCKNIHSALDTSELNPGLFFLIKLYAGTICSMCAPCHAWNSCTHLFHLVREKKEV